MMAHGSFFRIFLFYAMESLRIKLVQDAIFSWYFDDNKANKQLICPQIVCSSVLEADAKQDRVASFPNLRYIIAEISSSNSNKV